ncbi:MAG: MerR family transcriptional regulator [Proteobacteria bacterium]|nr:MerR family transcriptional regulator [Pseudomonadota bacterium]
MINKKYFNIDEISKLLNEKKHTIRFWEDRIQKLDILRTASGHRLYNYDNFLTIKKIQSLINDKKLTLEGVNTYFNSKKNNRYLNKNISLELRKLLQMLKSSI